MTIELWNMNGDSAREVGVRVWLGEGECDGLDFDVLARFSGESDGSVTALALEDVENLISMLSKARDMYVAEQVAA